MTWHGFPERNRVIDWLRDSEEFSYREIGEVFGIGPQRAREIYNRNWYRTVVRRTRCSLCGASIREPHENLLPPPNKVDANDLGNGIRLP